MAIDRTQRYPGRFDPVTPEQPQGAFKNRTTATSRDGSYLESDWLNDFAALFSSMLVNAGVTANGNVDEVGASQYYDALIDVTTPPDGTTSEQGTVTLATLQETINGTRDDRVVTPIGLASLISTDSRRGLIRLATLIDAIGGTRGDRAITPRTLTELFNSSGRQLLSGSGYQVLPGGMIIQWGQATSLPSGSVTNVSLPISFPNSGLIGLCTRVASGNSDNNIMVSSISTSEISLNNRADDTGGVFFLAIGH